MAERGKTRTRSATGTAPTITSKQADTPLPGVPALAIVLEADRIGAGAWLVAIDGAQRISLQRGKERRVEWASDEVVVSLPDGRMSKPHARIDLHTAARITDLGSSNGTFLLGEGGEERVDSCFIPRDRIFRVGHTFATLISDAAILIERERLSAPWPFTTLSPAFAHDLSKLERVATSTLPIMLLGETGTGKEVIAKATHERSMRSGKFVPVNCGALPANLVEAHLFGHQKGSFSGAVKAELGFVRAAHRGTLFLDEIGDLPLSAQVALLRVLQEGEVTPVGAFEAVKVDVRVISATHKNLPLAVTAGEFRADLYARLAGFAFDVPPLRARPTDLGALLAGLGANGEHTFTLRPDAAGALLRYDYPMNVRELQHAVGGAAVLVEGGAIRAADLPARIREFRSSTWADADLVLKQEIEAHMRKHNGNLTQVGREMGKARQQVQRWVKRFGLKG